MTGTIHLPEDLELICEMARSFPEDVQAAHDRLHARVPFSAERGYYGLSRPEGGAIVYRAAAGLLPGESGAGSEVIRIKKGRYAAMLVADFMKDVPAIGEAFRTLLSNPALDPDSWCVERYEGKDVRCMVRLRDGV
ncbi:MAG: transcriptional regulator [Chitinophagaceae bacterium]|nr:MAG: transcriptional regulator [Chitinophagaceae bacterium]